MNNKDKESSKNLEATSQESGTKSRPVFRQGQSLNHTKDIRIDEVLTLFEGELWILSNLF